jgi:3-hydroxybutyryl-CoA dehydrogenase
MGDGEECMTSLAIIGPGKLGLSLARHATDQGITVHLAGRNAEHVRLRLAAASSRWPSNLPNGQSKQRLIQIHDSWESALATADAVLEALPEDLSIKAEAWAQIGKCTRPEVLCMTGSSSIPLKRIREKGQILPHLLGFHLFVPVHRMRVVELVHEIDTPNALIQQATQWGSRLGLRVVHVKDQPGFAASRMALAQGLEAMRLVEQGIASPEDLDTLMVLGYGHPVGPLELSDRVGLDLRLAISQELYKATSNPVFAPPSILEGLVSKGHHGRTTGKGFFEWTPEGQRQ